MEVTSKMQINLLLLSDLTLRFPMLFFLPLRTCGFVFQDRIKMNHLATVRLAILRLGRVGVGNILGDDFHSNTLSMKG